MENAETRSLSEAAKYVLERFKHYGVDVPASSRFKQFHQAVCNDDGSSRDYISENESHFETAWEALRDSRQLEFFFDQIRDDSENSKYAPIIKRMVKDSVFPQDDMENSHGRDAQAEAFAFAVCKNAGLNPILEEPDVSCTMNDQKLGIAVKRIKSLPQLEKRLMKAAEQIERTGMTGIISAEITPAVNPENLSIATNQNEDQVRFWWTAKMKKAVGDCDARLWQALEDKGVLGVFLHEHCAVRFDSSYLPRSMTYGIETAGHNKTPWLEFRKRFKQGLPNLVP